MKTNNFTNARVGQNIKLILLSWISMVGFDFFLHAGVLAPLYAKESAFLLPPERAFALIPVGYLSFLGLAILLVWLMTTLALSGWRAGAIFGLKLGFLAWGSLVLGLYSISTAPPILLLGWLVGQVAELGIAGGVVGYGRSAENLKRISMRVLVFVFVAIIIGIVWQNISSLLSATS